MGLSLEFHMWGMLLCQCFNHCVCAECFFSHYLHEADCSHPRSNIWMPHVPGWTGAWAHSSSGGHFYARLGLLD